MFVWYRRIKPFLPTDAFILPHFVPIQTPTVLLLAKLKWMSLMDRGLYSNAVMIYKTLNGLVPAYMQDMSKQVKNISQ